MVSKYRVEDEHLPQFRQIFPATELKSHENIKEALTILSAAAKSFERAGVKSEITKVLEEVRQSKAEVKATFGVQYV